MPDISCPLPEQPTPADAGRAYRQARKALQGLGPAAYKREAARILGIDHDHYDRLYKQAISKKPVAEVVKPTTPTPRLAPKSMPETVVETADMTPEKALREYAWGLGDNGGLFLDINSTLRAGRSVDSMTPKASQVTRGLDKAFDQQPTLGQSKTVYRQFPGRDTELVQQIVDTARAGKVFEDKGFMSTTTDLDILEDFDNFGGGVRMNIRIPRGGKAIHVDDFTTATGNYAQDEWLLPRGTSLRLRNPRRADDGWEVDADVVVPGRSVPAPQVRATSAAGRIEDLERRIASKSDVLRKKPQFRSLIEPQIRAMQKELRSLRRK